jgi:drug/metabolite transporter (DMT)-like permease
MSYILFAWTAAITSGLIIIISKLTSKHSIANPWLFNLLWTLVGVIIIVPLAIINHASIPTYWIPIIFSALFGTLFYLFYVLSIYRLDVSTIAPLFNFRSIFAVLLGVFFFRETLSMYQIVLSAIVISAGIFATIDEKINLKSFFSPSIGIALAAMAFLALSNTSTKWASQYNDVWTINLWVGVISLTFVALTYPLFKKDLFKIRLHHVWPVGLMGILQTVTNFALTSALAVNVGKTSVIMSIPFSMILAALFSVFAPKLLEKHTAKIYAIRFTAAAVMIYGAFQLSQ